ncbi:hypothetical protein EPO15_10055 [bacterium]|nr:MAG: hypothetical protein EPO15_10055 [bacterium]
MKMITTVVSMMLALPAAAQAPALEKVGGDVKALVQTLKKDVKEQKDFSIARVTNIWVEQDCQKVTFEAGGSNVSAPIALESKTWVEECDDVYLPPGGSMCVPRGRRLMTWDNATATVEFAERGTPAVTEVVEVCLWGRSLSGKVKKSPFKYNSTEKDGRITLTLKK